MPIHLSGGAISDLDTETNVVSIPPTIAHVPITAADTEVPYTLPAGTKRFEVYNFIAPEVTTPDEIRLGYAPGEAVDEVVITDNKWRPVEAGCQYWEDELETDSFPHTIYLESSTVPLRAVIKSWQV